MPQYMYLSREKQRLDLAEKEGAYAVWNGENIVTLHQKGATPVSLNFSVGDAVLFHRIGDNIVMSRVVPPKHLPEIVLMACGIDKKAIAGNQSAHEKRIRAFEDQYSPHRFDVQNRFSAKWELNQRTTLMECGKDCLYVLTTPLLSIARACSLDCSEWATVSAYCTKMITKETALRLIEEHGLHLQPDWYLQLLISRTSEVR